VSAMPEIIPNWHPITIHFTVGLLITSTLLMLVASAGQRRSWGPGATAVARWNLALGILAATAALATGWYAYNTVVHDDPSHANMVVHLRWAFGAAAAYLIVAFLAWLDRRRNAGAAMPVLLASIVAAGVLIVTAWYGGENVYRYGLGVQALPDQSHHHHGAPGQDHDDDHDHAHAH
jgi:uncharacterized membrane protein